MEHLYLGDLSGYTEEGITEHFITVYQAGASEVAKYQVLIAGEWEDSYDGHSYFLLKDKETGRLYEVHGSHCSCYGFEGQFEPEEASIEYLKSEHYPNRNDSAIKQFVDGL